MANWCELRGKQMLKEFLTEITDMLGNYTIYSGNRVFSKYCDMVCIKKEDKVLNVVIDAEHERTYLKCKLTHNNTLSSVEFLVGLHDYGLNIGSLNGQLLTTDYSYADNSQIEELGEYIKSVLKLYNW